MPKMPQQSPEAQLTAIAKQAMTEYGLLHAFPADVVRELNQISGPLDASDGEVRDLRELPLCSIDNDDSRDLDQLSCSQPVSKDSTRILLAIADVDSHVRKGSKVDGRAKHNTTSVYCPTVIFNMLPEKLSYGLTSLNEGEDRLAMVTDMEVGRGGVVKASSHYRALVRNKAKLTYSAVGAWRPYVVLTGETKMAPKKCNHCGEWKDEEEFSWRYKSLGVRNKACKMCMGEFNKQYYQGDTYEQHKEDIKERKAVSR